VSSVNPDDAADASFDTGVQLEIVQLEIINNPTKANK